MLLRKLDGIVRLILRVCDDENRSRVAIDTPGDELSELSDYIGKMQSTINEHMIAHEAEQEAIRQAQTRALYSQINAHFIYNILESIKMMAEIEDSFHISDAHTALGNLLRYCVRCFSTT